MRLGSSNSGPTIKEPRFCGEPTGCSAHWAGPCQAESSTLEVGYQLTCWDGHPGRCLTHRFEFRLANSSPEPPAGRHCTTVSWSRALLRLHRAPAVAAGRRIRPPKSRRTRTWRCCSACAAWRKDAEVRVCHYQAALVSGRGRRSGPNLPCAWHAVWGVLATVMMKLMKDVM